MYEFSFKDKNIKHPTIICDIKQPAISGQDFVIRHDYKNMEVKPGNNLYPCWIKGEADMVCTVHIKEDTEIPPLSGNLVPVTVTGLQHLRTAGLVDGNKILHNQLVITPGKIDIEMEFQLYRLSIYLVKQCSYIQARD
jgi:hypothetical protein